jgi:hypothetical protein
MNFQFIYDRGYTNFPSPSKRLYPHCAFTWFSAGLVVLSRLVVACALFYGSSEEIVGSFALGQLAK